jgi:hypothetical protein
MARLQYKICIEPQAPGVDSWDLVVYGRRIAEDGTVGPWKNLLLKRTYVDPMLYDGNRRLKVLLRSLA